MNDLAVWVSGWDAEGNERLASQLRSWNIPHVFTWCNFEKHEPQNYNHCIDESVRMGYKYILISDSDVTYAHQETIPAMYDSIINIPQCGSIRPWRQGEKPEPDAKLDLKYVDDNTSMLMRLDIGARYDEIYLFTGWSDLEIGMEIERLGYWNMSDRRWPVSHDPTRSRSHNKSSALDALKKRNKLIHDWKWWGWGYDRWTNSGGLDGFNAEMPIEKRIPSMQQIIAYSNEDQKIWGDSICPEHHQIWVKDHRENPNLTWLNPLIVGYSTRDKFCQEHGYG